MANEYWGDLNVFFGGSSKEEVAEMFDRLMDAAADVLCGRDEPDHECAIDWTAGGQIRSDEAESTRNDKMDAAEKMYDALEHISAICREKGAPWDTTLADIYEAAENAILVAKVGEDYKKQKAGRRRHEP